MHIGAVSASAHLAPMTKTSEATEGPGPDHDHDGDEAPSVVKSPTAPATGSIIDVSA